MMREFDALEMEAVRRWQSGFVHPPGLLETIANWVGLPPLLVAVQFLLPTFTHVRGCVLLPWAYDPVSFERWWAELGGDCRRIEGVLNHLHLWDVVPNDSDADDATLRALGEALAQSWADQLARQAPDRGFDVVFSEDGEDYGPTVSIVSV